MSKDSITWVIFWFGVGFILATLLWGCGDSIHYDSICEASPDSVASVEAAIIDGEPSPDRRATVKVFNVGGGYCSGVVLGPHTVITAGHCKNPNSIYIQDYGSFLVSDHFAHPEYNGNARNDIRILRVDDELPPPFASIATPHIECIKAVAQGYGVGSNGELHEREIFIGVQYDELIVGTEGLCNGDSGGPLWAIRADGTYALLGVNTLTFDESGGCDGATGYASMLILGEWVYEQIR